MNTKRIETLQISGMSCNHCVKAVDQALKRVDSVDVEHVEIGEARVAYDPTQTSRETLVDAIKEEGFTVQN